jgi:hypothetical protein
MPRLAALARVKRPACGHRLMEINVPGDYHLHAVPMPNPAASSANVPPLRR